MELTLSTNAQRVLDARYLRRGANGRPSESAAELFARVARAVSEAELVLGSAREASRWEATFHELLTSLDFLPNSPTLMNAGTPLGQLCACFVLPVEDSMEEIFDSLAVMALVQRSGGGTGFSFSRLRPKGATVSTTGGAASGPVSFMRIFDCATENIRLGGRRRGANMGVLRVDHPDVLEFIDAKRDGSFSAFNLSVGVTDPYMEAVRQERPYGLVDPKTGREVAQLPAVQVFRAIVNAAWETGDPGVLFLDTINRANPVPHLGPIEATNPCGEVPLLPYEACTLGSINLAHMVAARAHGPTIDWARLADTARSAVRFLDDVVEVGRWPDPRIEAAARRTRKIGVGVMGFADMLLQLGIPYDSPDAVATAHRVMSAVRRGAQEMSSELADARGPYPAWAGVTGHHGAPPARNATVTAIAPTGTIGIIANTTAGIEPLFALAYRRAHTLGGAPMVELPGAVLQACERHGVDLDTLLASVAETGTVRDAAAIPDPLRRLLVTALEVPPGTHLQIQAAFQRCTDNSVSKTVNLPRDAKREDVAGIFLRAWELGLKGVTVYRYGSAHAPVVELGLGEEPFHIDHASRCDPTECRV